MIFFIFNSHIIFLPGYFPEVEELEDEQDEEKSEMDLEMFVQQQHLQRLQRKQQKRQQQQKQKQRPFQGQIQGYNILLLGIIGLKPYTKTLLHLEHFVVYFISIVDGLMVHSQTFRLSQNRMSQVE